MKYLSIVYILLSIPSFFIVNDKEELHLLDALPTNFSYQLNSDSIAILNYRGRMRFIVHSKKEMTIGCYKPIKVKPLFSIAIGHQFLFEDIEEFDLFIDNEKTSDYRLILYAVKKSHSETDTLLLKALNEYCIYGQSEYVFQSDDYILFTYSYAMNSGGTVHYLKRLGLWNKIEDTLVNNLNRGASILSKTQLPIAVINPYHKKEIIQGEFIWESGNSPAVFHTYLKLKENNSAIWISNYNQPKSFHFKYKCRWFMDNTYIYVYNSQSDIKTYMALDKNRLRYISKEYDFVRTR